MFASHTEDSEGMGTPVLSLEAVLQDHPELPPAAREAEEDAARNELNAAVAEDMEYWERLASACYMNDPDDAAMAKVPEQFREHAMRWARAGGNLDMIKDWASHKQVYDDRAARRSQRKATRERAAELKRQFDAAKAAGRPAPVRRPQPQRQSQPPADMYPEIDATLPLDAGTALMLLDMEEPKVPTDGEIVKTVPEISGELRQLTVQAYDHMSRCFNLERIKRRYGFTSSDLKQRELVAGQDVPSYYANVHDQSIWRRKQLSIAGLRNLVIYGPTIYQQLKDIHFSGDLDQHRGDSGLGLMRRVTGNVVDLDTTVLRCSDRTTLNAINASNKHKGLPTFRDTDAFAKSDQAQEIAKHCAVPLLQDFAKHAGLTTEAEIQRRKIDPAAISTPCHVAGSNTDRGKYPVWQYVNCGQNSFHVNVPTLDDVNGALLKAPFQCVRLWLTLHALYSGGELDKRIDAFFEDCVVDSCFNMKWKAIEESGHKMAHEGTIVDVLQRLQVEHQGIFTCEFFDADDDEQSNEIAEMVKVSVGQSKVARDKAGTMRMITAEDVAAWVRDPAVIL